MNKDKVIEILNNIDKINILVVGDIVLDHYIQGDIKRLNPEEYGAPLIDVNKHFDVIGCAANTANNIVSLGAECYLYSVVGNDETGSTIKKIIHTTNIKSRIIEFNNRITSKKTRLISNSRKRQIARYDEEIKKTLDDKETKEFLNSFSKEDLDKCQVYIVSDYAKGLINKKIIDFLKLEAKKRSKLLLTQPKPVNYSLYKGIDMMVNVKEAKEIANINNQESIEKIGRRIAKENNSNLIVTYGKEGMGFFGKKDLYVYVPTKPIEAYDETGAGDTALATVAIGLALGLRIKDSMNLANHASGVVVRKVGTSVLTKQELIDSFKEDP